MKNIAIKDAYQVAVTGMIFLDNEIIFLVGQDACVKTWSIKYYQV